MGACVFCAVLRGEAPASIVHEDDLAVAFLDLFPIQAGHTLVVPREHVRDLSTCPPDLAAHVFAVSADLAPAIARATGAPAFNVWTANGREAGQEVFHLHLHILPRHHDDAFGLRFPKGYPSQADRTELDEMARRIRQEARR